MVFSEEDVGLADSTELDAQKLRGNKCFKALSLGAICYTATDNYCDVPV